ncbi:LysR family transcriptional regulator [Cystobacter fuscus]|uniref:LysR family transcriptional regulator n=1 Tax=Cystobacter fuscus TaxID=43 RepID=UPI0005BBF708|nr:LysR family transcriptional regulator [Cystobacter fuscus]
MPAEKRTPSLDWDDLRHFAALARHGSLAAASRALGAARSTIARRVEGLERRLGRPLLVRTPDGFRLTDDGATVLAQATAMEEAALVVQRRLEGDDGPKGPVRLTTSRSLAHGFLVDRMGPLHDRHPGLDVEFIAETRVLSLSRGEADIAIRLGRPADSDLLARRAATVGYAFFAPARKRDALLSREQPPLVGYGADHQAAEAAWMASRFPSHRFIFRSNSLQAQAAAAQVGYGIVLLPCFLAASYPGLVRIPFGPLPPEREVWILMRRDSARVPRVKAVGDHLFELFRDERALLSGAQAQRE